MGISTPYEAAEFLSRYGGLGNPGDLLKERPTAEQLKVAIANCHATVEQVKEQIVAYYRDLTTFRDLAEGDHFVFLEGAASATHMCRKVSATEYVDYKDDVGIHRGERNPVAVINEQVLRLGSQERPLFGPQGF